MQETGAAMAKTSLPLSEIDSEEARHPPRRVHRVNDTRVNFTEIRVARSQMSGQSNGPGRDQTDKPPSRIADLSKMRKCCYRVCCCCHRVD